MTAADAVRSDDNGATALRELRDLSTLRWRSRVTRASAALATTDGRWAAVSTGMTAIVAASIAWMAVGTLPMTNPVVSTTHIPLTYELFLRLLKVGSNLPRLEAPPEADHGNGDPGVETRTVTLDSGDTLAGVLEDAGISSQDANAAVAAMGKDFSPRAIKAGMSVDVTYAIASIDASGANAAATPARPKTTIVMVNHKPVEVPLADDNGEADATPGTSQPISRLLALHFSPSVEQDITITRTMAGGFDAQLVKKELQVHRHRVGGTIDSSLYLSAMQAGIPAAVVQDLMNNILPYKVDFQREVHPGDSFEVYYDYYYTPEGLPAKYGSISYARMRLSGKDIVLYRYQPDPDQAPEYFDAHGESAKGMLMKTPVDGARISSGFGSRFHPVLGYTRMHKGIDFAVPVGTPVKAAGTGTIQFMGAASGYGNFLKIDMGNGWGTGYAHLSRFAPGLRKGARVRQGEVVAFSGNTGLTTGPHLHYEIFEHGTQINPLTVKAAQGRTLVGRELASFVGTRLKMDETMANVPLETRVSDASTDLRQAKAK
jgi:murein DD-endopeptidase MepM/ murein hydrolase activator NlpD